MTKKEVKRLQIFIKEHGREEVLGHSFIITQTNDYVGAPTNDDKQYKRLTASSFLGVPFNKIKRLSLWISTSKGVFYF